VKDLKDVKDGPDQNGADMAACLASRKWRWVVMLFMTSFVNGDRSLGAASQAGVWIPCGWSADMRALDSTFFWFTVIPVTL
jgi:hypothetical protein